MRAAPCICIVLLVYLSFSFGDVSILNNYIDAVIDNVAESSSVNGSLSLPEISKSIEQTSVVNLFESYDLSNGKLDKLETFVRSKDVTLNYTNNVAELDGGFSFTDLQVTYDFKVVGTYEFLSLHGSLYGSIQEMNVSFDLSGNTNTLQLKANSIRLDSPGEISLQVETSTVTQWVLNKLLDFTTEHFESAILSAVQNAIMNAINSYFSFN